MSLIEGIGDEVTIVFGLLLVAVVILLAWFSTHTNDLSLFREMGVIVVELSQRRPAPLDARAESASAEISGDEHTPTSHAHQTSTPSPSSDVPESRHGEFSTASSSTDVSPGASGLSNQSNVPEVVPASKVLQVQPADESASPHTLFPSEGHGETGRVLSEHNLLGEEVMISDSRGRNNEGPISQVPLAGEEMRQRRVQYFQKEGCQDTEESSVHDSSACSANIPLQGSESEEKSGISPNEKTDNLLQVTDESNRLSNQPNVSEDLLASSSTSEITDSEISRENLQRSDSQICVRLRYMNETQRCVFAKPDDTIGDFRRTHFQSELEDNKWVRFIFNGQDLRDDARTLQACNIVNNSTMHCLVTSRARNQPQQDAAGEEEDDSMLGTLMYPLFTILLAIVWYFRFTYRQYFSAMSTVCLIGISFILVLSYLSSFRMSDSQHVQQAHPATQSTPGNSNSRSRDSNSD